MSVYSPDFKLLVAFFEFLCSPLTTSALSGNRNPAERIIDPGVVLNAEAYKVVRL
jgi:hypothetical protein